VAVQSSIVGNADRKPTEVGYYLLSAMRAAGIPSAAQLARDAKVSGSTLSRIMYGHVERPEAPTLDRLADALVAASASALRDPEALAKAQLETRTALRLAAGYNTAPIGRRIDPQALEIDKMIGEDTVLNPDEVQYLRSMLDHLVAPYRGKVRRRAG
jgi:transcriptional regulator with XRE-family HTH domain